MRGVQCGAVSMGDPAFAVIRRALASAHSICQKVHTICRTVSIVCRTIIIEPLSHNYVGTQAEIFPEAVLGMHGHSFCAFLHCSFESGLF